VADTSMKTRGEFVGLAATADIAMAGASLIGCSTGDGNAPGENASEGEASADSVAPYSDGPSSMANYDSSIRVPANGDRLRSLKQGLLGVLVIGLLGVAWLCTARTINRSSISPPFEDTMTYV
jgi:hypothetical protein